jgi:hypothetical protein
VKVATAPRGAESGQPKPQQHQRAGRRHAGIHRWQAEDRNFEVNDERWVEIRECQQPNVRLAGDERGIDQPGEAVGGVQDDFGNDVEIEIEQLEVESRVRMGIGDGRAGAEGPTGPVEGIEVGKIALADREVMRPIGSPGGGVIGSNCSPTSKSSKAIGDGRGGTRLS